jgi:hypothetical protein
MKSSFFLIFAQRESNRSKMKKFLIVVSIIIVWWISGRLLFKNGCCKESLSKESLSKGNKGYTKKNFCSANLAGYTVSKGWKGIQKCVEQFGSNVMDGCKISECKKCPDAGYDTKCRDIFPLYLQEYDEDQGCLKGEWCHDKSFRTDWVDPLPELERAPIVGCSMPDNTRPYIENTSCDPQY